MIQGKTINLWALERSDLINNYVWCNDPELIFLTGMSPYPKSSWEFEKWFDSVLNNPGAKVYAIKTREGQHIGNIELSGIDTRCGKGEIGLVIGEKDFLNRGCGREAIRLMLGFAFREMGLHRVSATVFSHNERALACFRKCGFLEEGRQREAHYSRGKYWDIVQLGILRDEFERSAGEES
jgi:RimJ/RimL family protein N-acetyltransferase